MKATLPEITKNEPTAKPWTCPKCGALVYEKPELHAYLCAEYRKRKGAKA
jgi:hypothetical protein